MSNTINVMTFNTYLLHVPKFSINESTQYSRINAMLADNIFSNIDIVILQEVFNPSAEDKLFEGMGKLGFIYQTPVAAKYNESIIQSCNSNYCWNSKKGEWDIIQQMNSGVAILSRHPIIFREYIIFTDPGCGGDRFGAKGGVYVIINVEGKRVHFFGTHMQSDDSFCIITQPSEHRKLQLTELIKWISKQSIPSDEAVIFGGDFNIDLGSNEYKQALSIIGWEEPELIDPQPTWDPETNALIQFASPDEKHRWHLDYIFAKNVASISEQTRVIKTETGYVYRENKYFEYSDHYPVVANIELL